MTCGECSSAACVYGGMDLKNCKYTYCTLRYSGTYKYGGYKGPGWTKVMKNSQPKWCPRKEEYDGKEI